MIRWLLVAAAFAGFTVFPADSGAQEKKKVPPAVAALLKSTPEEVIRRLDKNKDGLLSKDELPPRLANAFDRFDANGDGRLNAQEVGRMLQVLRKRFGTAEESKPGADEAVEQSVAWALQAMDKNKDGKISKAEAQGRLAEVFDRFDANADGFLDKAELRKLAAAMPAQQGGRAGGQPAAGRAPVDFDSLDANADGRLTRDELKGTAFYDAFDEIDANKDGKVAPKEFEAYLKKRAEAKDAPPARKKP